MFKLMGSKKVFVLLLAFIVFLGLFGWTLRDRTQLSWPERLVKDSVSWTQGLFYKPARSIAGFFQDIRDLKVTYQENKVLRMTLSQYARDTMKLNDLEYQNNRLKDLLAFTERQKEANNYKYHVAEVIAVSSDPFSNVVTINLGSKDGMKNNMAVMSVDGLLGRINRVTDFNSTVQLLAELDETSNASKGIAATVKGKENESFGIIESYDVEQQMLAMTKIQQTDKVEVGDTIITSGLGQIFPKGIEIGKVVSKEVDKFGLTYKAMVQPKATFRHLREVLVVEVPDQG